MNQVGSPFLFILVVDDEPLVRMVAVDILVSAGFATFDAEDAPSALRQISDHPEIDLLFTDINMPGQIDGLALAHLVHSRRPEMAKILTSGRERPDQQAMPERSCFLPKPYTRGSMLDLIGVI